MAIRDNLLGVLITQLVKAEVALIGDMQCLCQQGGGIELTQFVRRAQMLLAITHTTASQLADTGVVPERSKNIVQ